MHKYDVFNTLFGRPLPLNFDVHLFPIDAIFFSKLLLA